MQDWSEKEEGEKIKLRLAVRAVQPPVRIHKEERENCVIKPSSWMSCSVRLTLAISFRTFLIV